MASHELSIVIPVLNDTEPLQRLLATIRADPRSMSWSSTAARRTIG
jgi:hypothetical protein